MIQAYLNIPYYLFTAAAASIANSVAVAVPAAATMITWQTFFGTAPASITALLQGSEDNVNWATIDTSTTVGGEIRTITTGLPFVRARVNAVSGGAEVNVVINCKNQ